MVVGCGISPVNIVSPNKILYLYSLEGSEIIKYELLKHTKYVHDKVSIETKDMVGVNLSQGDLCSPFGEIVNRH